MRIKFLVLFCLLTGAVFSKNRIAVLEFKNNGSKNLNHFSAGIPDMLTTTFANSTKISVVERQQIQKIISEMNLGTTGLVDPGSAAEVGKVTGANLVIIGSFIDLGRKVRIDAKVVSVNSSEIIPGATQNVKANSIEDLDIAVDKLAGKLLNKLTGEVTSASSQSKQSSGPGKKNASKQTVTTKMTIPGSGTFEVTTETSEYEENAGVSSNEDSGSKQKILTAMEFERLKQALKKESFEDTRFKMFASALRNKMIKVAQLKKILALFSFEDTKIKVAKMGYTHCTDKDNFYKLYSSFDFDSSKEELMEWVEEQ